MCQLINGYKLREWFLKGTIKVSYKYIYVWTQWNWSEFASLKCISRLSHCELPT